MWSIRVELEYETDIHEKALDREKVEKMRNGLHAGDNEPTRAMRETLATRGVGLRSCMRPIMVMRIS